MIRSIYIKLKNRIVNKYSNKGKELSYWKRTGIKKGTDHYKKYLQKFKLLDENLQDNTIGDFGCGPFGGIISVINTFKIAYPIDILADEYNKLSLCEEKIIKFDGKNTQLKDNCIDVMFCCNTLDHTRKYHNCINEIHRLLKNKGQLYIAFHLRQKKQLNLAHPIAWNEVKFKKEFSSLFLIEWLEIDNNDVVNTAAHPTLYAKLLNNKNFL